MVSREGSGRLLVLESMSVTCLALLLANSRNDPQSSLAHELLETMRKMIDSKAEDMPADERRAATDYANQLFTEVLRNVKNMRTI